MAYKDKANISWIRKDAVADRVVGSTDAQLGQGSGLTPDTSTSPPNRLAEELYDNIESVKGIAEADGTFKSLTDTPASVPDGQFLLGNASNALVFSGAPGTAFNKAFTTSGGDNGTSTDVARGNHKHDSLYYTESEVDNLLAGVGCLNLGNVYEKTLSGSGRDANPNSGTHLTSDILKVGSNLGSVGSISPAFSLRIKMIHTVIANLVGSGTGTYFSSTRADYLITLYARWFSTTQYHWAMHTSVLEYTSSSGYAGAGVVPMTTLVYAVQKITGTRSLTSYSGLTGEDAYALFPFNDIDYFIVEFNGKGGEPGSSTIVDREFAKIKIEVFQDFDDPQPITVL